MKVISGGQTGADRGALEAALSLGLPYGGTVPKGRKASDGQVPPCFDRLVESVSDAYPPRTLANIRDSDATVVFARFPVSGGSKLTVRLLREEGKPFVVHCAEKTVENPLRGIRALTGWLARLEVRVLNVAGSRESSVPGVQAAVRHLFETLLPFVSRSTDLDCSWPSCDRPGSVYLTSLAGLLEFPRACRLHAAEASRS